MTLGDLVPLEPAGDEFLVNQEIIPIAYDPQIARQVGDDGFIVSWGYEEASPGIGVSARFFANDGTIASDALTVFLGGAKRIRAWSLAGES